MLPSFLSRLVPEQLLVNVELLVLATAGERVVLALLQKLRDQRFLRLTAFFLLVEVGRFSYFLSNIKVKGYSGNLSSINWSESVPPAGRRWW